MDWKYGWRAPDTVSVKLKTVPRPLTSSNDKCGDEQELQAESGGNWSRRHSLQR